MSRRPFAAIPVLTVLLILSGTVFQAQTAQRTLNFAELTYGRHVTAMARTAAGDVWFGGQTCSTTLPTTSGAVQPIAGGTGCRGFIGRMTSDGRVTYLSYFGGSRESSVTALTLDAAGNVTVAGWTYSTDFPTTPGAYDRTCGNDGTCLGDARRWEPQLRRYVSDPASDGFVSTLAPAGDRIVYSTYVGGKDNDVITSVAVDSTRRVHVAGWTTTSDFPTTAGALQPSFAYGTDVGQNVLPDAFYARLSPDVSALQYGTYLGGYHRDGAASVAVDAAGDAFVTGYTQSEHFPTKNAVQPTNNSRVQYPYTLADAWLARFSGTDALYSTYVGGSDSDSASSIAVVDGDVYLGGSTCSTDFPGAPQPNAECKAFISELNGASGGVSRTVVLHDAGGSDGIGGIAVDANHVVYAAGSTSGSNVFPTTPDAAQRTSGGGRDAFLAIVDMRAGGSLLYSTYFGGVDDDSAWPVALDGSGGAYFGGSSASHGDHSSFPAHNAQPRPAPEPPQTYTYPPNLASFVAYVSVRESAPSSAGDIVLYARDARAITGNWQLVADTSAAAGTRIWNPDAGVPKIGTASPSPASFFELTFNAEAGVMYHLWLRMKADNNSWTNDSVFVQFSDSVDGAGNPVWRTGTTSAAMVSLEDCSGCGEHGWGWNDNGYNAPALPVTFGTSGTHTIRIQQREDGISIDQVVLSRQTYFSDAPGAQKDDTTILAQSDGSSEPPPPPPPPPSDPREIVIYAAADRLAGGQNWLVTSDATAAGGARLLNPDAGQPKLSSPSASGSDYFEVQFTAEAGVPYHLWVRSQATNDYWTNDSVFVQFSDSVDASGSAIWRIGSDSATVVSTEDCSGCGAQGWGWNDNAYGGFAAPIYFSKSGPQTIRILRREDGISIDQIVLSAGRYLNAAPGAPKNDTTIVPQ